MKWLIWKEYRVNRLILIVGAVLLVGPHAIALFLAWCWIGRPTHGDVSHLANNLYYAAIASVQISLLTLAFLGGHAIACERADRSAEFLAYLPVSRARILAAKIALALLCMALIWIPNSLIVGLVTGEWPWHEHAFGVWQILGMAALTGFAFFSVGWLLSSILESPTFSICGALITPPLIIAAGSLSLDQIDNTWYLARILYVFTCLAIAPTCLIEVALI